jgi:hypothetical protein
MNRSLLLMLGALIVLVLIYMGIKSSRDATYHPEAFVKVDTLKADAVRIHTKDDDILLQKQAGEWQLTEPVRYPADSRLVLELLSKLTGMELETAEPLSQDPDRDTVFQVGDQGTRLMVMAGTDTMANVIVGKISSDSRHTYARKAGDKNVYLVKGMYTSQLTRRTRDWRDKVILDIAKDSIRQIDLQWPEQIFSLVKEDSIWTLEEGGRSLPADKQKVEHLASSFFKFRTLEFVDGESAQAVDFSKPDFTIHITTDSGKRSFSLLVMPNDENRFYLKRDDLESTLFIIYRGTAEVYMKKADNFKVMAS